MRDALATGSLEVIVRTLYAEGLNEAHVLGVLEQLRAELRTQHREVDEDVVMEAMDRVAGFCSPQARLQRDLDGSH
jgi:hypothetical protein